MEDSGSAGPRTGWLPQHAALRDGSGRLVAAAPMYAKSNSYGEYVFDHGWANAYEQAGGDYYPKLQVAVPFSPGARAAAAVPAGRRGAAAALARRWCRHASELKLSGVHATFCTAGEWEALGAAGWLQRLGQQYHWENAGYGTFDDFLGALSSRKRKVLRRERRDANDCGLVFRTLRGAEIGRREWDAFYRFYQSTVDRKWGSAYLTKRFFPLLGERLGDRVVLMLAEHKGEPVAGALNLLGRDALYGRNWGCRGDFPFLHFELCYYRAIDFAIEHGVCARGGRRAGPAQDPARLPAEADLLRPLADPSGLRSAVDDFLRRERPAVLEGMAELEAEYSPYRKDGEAG